MHKKIVKSVFLGSLVILNTMISCSKNTEPNPNTEETNDGVDRQDRKFITLTAALPSNTTPPVAGDGGTVAFALTEDQARDASKTIDIFKDGYGLRSQRTARVQASINGNYLFNIQFNGTDGGVFNKYSVNGGNIFTDTGQQINTAPILGATPRWVKSAEGIGIGVDIRGASAIIDPVKAENGTQTYVYTKGTAAVALLDLNNPRLINSTEFEFPFTEEEKKEGYAVARLDVPILNSAKNKVYIGCNITKVNPNIGPSKVVNARTGVEEWIWASDATNIKGTVTLVLDYPSLGNPSLIWSTQSIYGNNSYRTMSQYLGTDGNVYQSTGANVTSYPHILRIDKNTNSYDNNYLFDLAQALNITSGRVGIKAWTYIQAGKAVALYDVDGRGGYIALLDLNALTAVKLSNEYETQLDLAQYQNIVVAGDYAYIALTPTGLDGQLYVVNWKNQTVAPGVKLKNQSGSFYIGSY